MIDTYSGLIKAVTRKYLRRIPTGNPKRPYRYVYKREPAKSSNQAVYITERESPLDYGSITARRLAITAESTETEETKNSYFHGTKEISFLDYSLDDQGKRVFIHYMKTRGDRTGEGHARALIENLYDKFADKEEINWGKLAHDHAEKLYREYRDRGDVPTYGKLGW